MRRIIQLDESEYNQLVDKASLNEKQIEERAINLYKENGAAIIDLRFRTINDTFYTKTFKCDSYVFYKDERFFISEKLRVKLGAFIGKYVTERINYDYKKPQELMEEYSKQLRLLKYTEFILFVVAAFGWAAFVIFLFMK